jgi:hypothetical protein
MASTFPGLQDPARWHSRGQPEAVPGIQEKTCQRPSNALPLALPQKIF